MPKQPRSQSTRGLSDMEAPRWREFPEGRLPTEGPINNGIIRSRTRAEMVKTAAGDGINTRRIRQAAPDHTKEAASVVNAVVELAAIRVWKKL
jgi:hypothetical protein